MAVGDGKLEVTRFASGMGLAGSWDGRPFAVRRTTMGLVVARGAPQTDLSVIEQAAERGAQYTSNEFPQEYVPQ